EKTLAPTMVGVPPPDDKPQSPPIIAVPQVPLTPEPELEESPRWDDEQTARLMAFREQTQSDGDVPGGFGAEETLRTNPSVRAASQPEILTLEDVSQIEGPTEGAFSAASVAARAVTTGKKKKGSTKKLADKPPVTTSMHPPPVRVPLPREPKVVA